jgi:hypothetical protein
MTSPTTYFELQELVCPHVYDVYKNRAWMFLDSRIILTLDTIRDRIGKSIFVNNWNWNGEYDERGLRCMRCDLVKAKIEAGEMYMSAHLFGKAVDFDVTGLTSEEVRLWIVAKANLWPYPIRLEKNVAWVHLDIFDSGTDQKVYLFT